MYNQKFPKRHPAHDTGMFEEIMIKTLSCSCHVPQWAREYFESLFIKPAQTVNSYLSEANFLETTLRYAGNQTEQIKSIVSYLVTHKPLTFEECIIWARLQFEENYNNSIQQLLYSLPKDAVHSFLVSSTNDTNVVADDVQRPAVLVRS